MCLLSVTVLVGLAYAVVLVIDMLGTGTTASGGFGTAAAGFVAWRRTGGIRTWVILVSAGLLVAFTHTRVLLCSSHRCRGLPVTSPR